MYSDQMNLKYHIARLDGSFTNLSNSVGQNEEFYKTEYAEMQESCLNLEMNMRNESASLDDRLSGQHLEIEKLYIKVSQGYYVLLRFYY